MKKTLFILMVALVFGWIYLKANKKPNVIDRVEPDNNALNSESFDSITKSKTKHSNIDKKVEPSLSNYKDFVITDEEMLELIKWSQNRGYWGKENPYHGYSFDSLKSMADLDDPLAQYMVGRELRSKGKLKESKKYLQLASINGLTSSLVELSSISKVQYLNNYLSGEYNSNELISAYAYLKVAIKRGDPNATTLLESLSLTDQSKLSDAQRIKVEIKAEEIYSELLQARLAKGMNDFDNSIPDSLWKVQQKSLNMQRKLRQAIDDVEY